MSDKTLNDITASVRLGTWEQDGVTLTQLREAIVAYDVLVSQLDVDANAVQLAEYFKATDQPVADYIGEANHPDNPEAISWYEAFAAVESEPAALPVPGDYVTRTGEDMFRVATPGYSVADRRAYGVPIVYEIAENETRQGLYGMDLDEVWPVTLLDYPELFQVLVDRGVTIV